MGVFLSGKGIEDMNWIIVDFGEFFIYFMCVEVGSVYIVCL